MTTARSLIDMRLLDHRVDLFRVLGAQADAPYASAELHVVRALVAQVDLASSARRRRAPATAGPCPGSALLMIADLERDVLGRASSRAPARSSGSSRRRRWPTTSSSGRPTLAPMAAGTPKPIVPRPPELIQLPGFLNRMYCDAHIWCWPTPATKIASPSGDRADPSITCCGLSGPSALLVVAQRVASPATSPSCAEPRPRGRARPSLVLRFASSSAAWRSRPWRRRRSGRRPRGSCRSRPGRCRRG